MQYRGSLSHSTVICLFELIFFYISCYAFRRDGSAILFIPTMIFVIHQCKQATVSFPVTIIAASARSWPNALTKLSACHWYWTGNDAMSKDWNGRVVFWDLPWSSLNLGLGIPSSLYESLFSLSYWQLSFRKKLCGPWPLRCSTAVNGFVGSWHQTCPRVKGCDNAFLEKAETLLSIAAQSMRIPPLDSHSPIILCIFDYFWLFVSKM